MDDVKVWVDEALETMESIHGPDSQEYVVAMRAIAAEALQRADHVEKEAQASRMRAFGRATGKRIADILGDDAPGDVIAYVLPSGAACVSTRVHDLAAAWELAQRIGANHGWSDEEPGIPCVEAPCFEHRGACVVLYWPDALWPDSE
jgi:hypothetical protein